MSLLYSLAELRAPFLTDLALAFTACAEELTVILVVCAVYWCVSKRVGVIVALSYFLSGLLVQGLKITFRIARPWLLDSSFAPVPEAMGTATGYSFPSGHTQSGTALFGTLGFLSRKKGVLAACCAMFFAIGMSRMYLGVHTPLDVFTSMALTLLISGLVALWSRKRDDIFLSPLEAGVLALFSVALCAYALILMANGTIAREYALDCVKASGAGLGFAAGLFVEERFVGFKTATAKLWQQPLKLALGLAGVVALKYGFAAVFGKGMAASFIGYALIIFWIIAIYPMIIKRFFEVKG